MSLNTLRTYFEFKLNNAIFEKFGVEEEDVKEAMNKSGKIFISSLNS